MGLVNRHGIDPAEVMAANELCTLLERAEKKTRRQRNNESVTEHTRRLLDVRVTINIREKSCQGNCQLLK